MNPNKGTSDEVLRRLKEESYERLRANIFEAVRKQLDDYGMTWDDLANALCRFRDKNRICPMWRIFDRQLLNWRDKTGQEVKETIGNGFLTSDMLNEIAHAFSAEVYVIFRPRFPFVNS